MVSISKRLEPYLVQIYFALHPYCCLLVLVNLITMKFIQYAAPLLVAASVVSAFPASKRNVTASEKKYIILDNDWSTTGFIPFLLALDAGYEVLGLASGKFSIPLANHTVQILMRM